MACVKMYHCDVNFTYPDGRLGMEQTLSYRMKQVAQAKATLIKCDLIEKGCTDIKVYTREVNAVCQS